MERGGNVEGVKPDQVADVELIIALMEKMIVAVWRDCLSLELEAPFPRISWADSMLRYGTDKPDLRFGLEIEDATAVTRGSGFGVFAGADAVRFLRAPKIFSRAELTALEEFAKQWGAKGLAYLIHDEAGEGPVRRKERDNEQPHSDYREGVPGHGGRYRVGAGRRHLPHADALP